MSRNLPNRNVSRLAKRLLDYEAARNDVARATVPALALVMETMRAHLVTIIGIASFRSLLGRALTIAKVQAPGLDIVHVDPDGSLALREFAALAQEDRSAEESTMVIATFLALLITLIGERLVLTLVRGAWPGIPVLNVGNLEESDHDPTH